MCYLYNKLFKLFQEKLIMSQYSNFTFMIFLPRILPLRNNEYLCYEWTPGNTVLRELSNKEKLEKVGFLLTFVLNMVIVVIKLVHGHAELHMRQCQVEVQVLTFSKTKVLVLVWRWLTLTSWCQNLADINSFSYI